MRLRRFAAVVHKPLKLLVGRFVAAVLRWFAVVTRKCLMKHGAVVLRWLRCGTPHTPYALRGAIGARRGRMRDGRRHERRCAARRGLAGSSRRGAGRARARLWR